MKPIYHKLPEVVIPPHSWQRWRERSSSDSLKKPGALRNVVRMVLNNALGQGVKTSRYKGEMVIRLDMNAGVEAVIAIDQIWGYVVRTFLSKEAS